MKKGRLYGMSVIGWITKSTRKREFSGIKTKLYISLTDLSV